MAEESPTHLCLSNNPGQLVRGFRRASLLPPANLPRLHQVNPGSPEHLKEVKSRHDRNLSEGFGTVHMRYSLSKEYPQGRQCVGPAVSFPGIEAARPPRTTVKQRRRFDESAMLKAAREATRAACLHKPAGCPTLGHSFSTYLPEASHDTRTAQELSGHEDVNTTMIYTHVLNKGALNARSPAVIPGRKHHMRPGIPFASLPSAIAHEFDSIAAARYCDDFEAAIKAFPQAAWNEMKIRRILQPGQPNTKKLVDTYGDNLICVRYRYDHDKKKMLKTIEIIVDSKPWECDPKDIPRNGIMNIRIAVDEMELRWRVKAAGGKWDPKRQVWQLLYEKISEPGLSDLIVDADEF